MTTYTEMVPRIDLCAYDLNAAKGVRVIETGHYYPCGGNVYIVSPAALADKRKNWHEVHGFGTGSAYVTHPDWFALLAKVRADFLAADPEHKVSKWIESYHMFAKVDADTIAHIGMIDFDPQHPERIRLEG